jgi:nucleotide-binding universal stress UspA family protein
MSGAVGGRLRIVHAVGLLEHAGLLHERTTVHQETALRIAEDAGAPAASVEWCVVDGDPCSALLRTTVPPDPADLLVVGSRGAAAHGGTLLGSTSLEVAEHSPVPVAIVPASYESA